MKKLLLSGAVLLLATGVFAQTKMTGSKQQDLVLKQVLT